MTLIGLHALRNLLGLLRRHDVGQPVGSTYLHIRAVEFYESGEIKRIEL